MDFSIYEEGTLMTLKDAYSIVDKSNKNGKADLKLVNKGLDNTTACIIASCTSLCSLELSYNLITDHGLIQIVTNIFLTHLDISNNYYTSNGIKEMMNKSCKLRSLILSIDNLDNNAFEAIRRCTSLERLNLDFDSIETFSSTSLKIILNNSSITKLVLNGYAPDIPDIYSPMFSNTILRSIGIYNGFLNLVDIIELCKLKSLKRLVIMFSTVNYNIDQQYEYIPDNTNLRSLILWSTRFKMEKKQLYFLTSLKSLKKLSLDICAVNIGPSVDMCNLDMFVLPCLESLDLAEDFSIPEIIKLKQLKYLTLRIITSEFLSFIVNIVKIIPLTSLTIRLDYEGSNNRLEYEESNNSCTSKIFPFIPILREVSIICFERLIDLKFLLYDKDMYTYNAHKLRNCPCILGISVLEAIYYARLERMFNARREFISTTILLARSTQPILPKEILMYIACWWPLQDMCKTRRQVVYCVRMIFKEFNNKQTEKIVKEIIRGNKRLRISEKCCSIYKKITSGNFSISLIDKYDNNIVSEIDKYINEE